MCLKRHGQSRSEHEHAQTTQKSLDEADTRLDLGRTENFEILSSCRAHVETRLLIFKILF